MNLFKNKKDSVIESVINEKIKELEKERDILWRKSEEEVKKYDWTVNYDEFINNEKYSKIGQYMKQINHLSYHIWVLRTVLEEAKKKNN